MLTTPEDIKTLRKRLDDGRWFAFVGSGPSRAVNFPTWKKLVMELCYECGLDVDDKKKRTVDELQSLANDAKNANKTRYDSYLRLVFGRTIVAIPAVYTLPLASGCKHYSHEQASARQPFQKSHRTVNHIPIPHLLRLSKSGRCLSSYSNHWLEHLCA